MTQPDGVCRAVYAVRQVCCRQSDATGTRRSVALKEGDLRAPLLPVLEDGAAGGAFWGGRYQKTVE